MAGYDLNGTLELDGVSQWSAITVRTPLHHSLTHSYESNTRTGTSKTSHSVVTGNATDLCSSPEALWIRNSSG